ncbi:MAG: DegT/DnrJ/EryC1/StrS family aminotransferase [Actinomycetota bacterium]|nr:DegT/DnrJ/EryC1/StrS family aminotransferase [Actinomycetota bacterium]
MSVPLFASPLSPYHERINGALSRVVESGSFILGPEVASFEEEFAAYVGVRHCVGVANGTDALAIALRSLGVQPGDEVVMPSLTFFATAEAAVDVGAVPVFCDVDLETACVNAETVRAALTPKTKAIVPVHLFGNVAPVPELRELGLPVLEDAAQAAGAALDERRAGSLGEAATFSFFPSKNLPCLGDGGAITTDSDEVAERARMLRFHGSRDKVTFEEVGYNSRLDELQAAALRVLLPELDGWTEARCATAAEYERRGLGEHVTLPRPVEGAGHAYHLYAARHPRADQLAGRLAERGVAARGYYRAPVHRQPAMGRFGAAFDLPATDELAATNLALPMGTQLSAEAVGEVVDACASGST